MPCDEMVRRGLISGEIPIYGLGEQLSFRAALARAILADLRKKDRPGVRVIADAHGVSPNTVQRIAHAQ
jgi:hypothetical protein